jgi:Zn-finger protein
MYWRRVMSGNVIPNCADCKWIHLENLCGAQGRKWPDEVYGTEECKKLYKPKKEKSK